MLKNLASGKLNATKNALFFLLRAPTHHSFVFNLLSFLFSFFLTPFRFYSSLCFCSTKSMDSLTLKSHNFSQKLK